MLTALLRTLALTAPAVLLAGCGSLATAPPAVQEVQGWVDRQCVPAASGTQIVCDVHLIVLNQGGKGSGYATMGVPVKGAGGAIVAPAQCVLAIPPVGDGDYAESSCTVALDKGDTVTAPPRVVSLTMGSESAPATDSSNLLLLLAGLVALNFLAVVWGGVQLRAATRRRGATSSAAPSTLAGDRGITT